MLTKSIRQILEKGKDAGWVMEPDAKKLFSLAGLDVTKFLWAKEPKAARKFAAMVGYPVVAKVVSPKVVHKSEVSGVATGIADAGVLDEAFNRFSAIDGFQGVIVEETVRGVELIIGGTMDYQFGPVVLCGLGGTAVEVYKDVALRMAPLRMDDTFSMIGSLAARPLLEGFRGAEPVNKEVLANLLFRFSHILYDLEGMVESIDLNPVICSKDRCVIADARIILKKD
jgi:acetate---CoA ligase (ADP-forming) subunit beta